MLKVVWAIHTVTRPSLSPTPAKKTRRDTPTMISGMIIGRKLMDLT
jgi:hypothetical protein